MSKIKPMGDVMHSLEKVLDQMVLQHDLQWYEVLSLVHGHLSTHYPEAQETYEDGTNPVFFYGPKKGE